MTGKPAIAFNVGGHEDQARQAKSSTADLARRSKATKTESSIQEENSEQHCACSRTISRTLRKDKARNTLWAPLRAKRENQGWFSSTSNGSTPLACPSNQDDNLNERRNLKWSGREDLNLLPPAPHKGNDQSNNVQEDPILIYYSITY
jgi:hypothetical protein